MKECVVMSLFVRMIVLFALCVELDGQPGPAQADDRVVFSNRMFSVSLPSKYFEGAALKDSLKFILKPDGEQFPTFFNGAPVGFIIIADTFYASNLKNAVERTIAAYNVLPDKFFFDAKNLTEEELKEVPEFSLRRFFDPVTTDAKSKDGVKFTVVSSRNYDKRERLFVTRYDVVSFNKNLQKAACLTLMLKHYDKTFGIEKIFKFKEYADSVISGFFPKEK